MAAAGWVARSTSASASSCAAEGSGRGAHGRGGRSDRLGVSVGVEDDARDVDAGDAVDQRVMGL